MTGTKKYIPMTDEQYRRLLVLIEVGEWVINSFRDEPIEEFVEIYKHICLHHNNFDAKDLVDYDPLYCGGSRKLEEEAWDYIDEYQSHDEDQIWADAVFKDGEDDDADDAHPQPGRNDPCPCGSGKKYKKCCSKKTTAIDDAPVPDGNVLPRSEVA